MDNHILEKYSAIRKDKLLTKGNNMEETTSKPLCCTKEVHIVWFHLHRI